MKSNQPSHTSIPSVRFVTITDAEAGQRVDNFLLRILKGVPKSRIYRILRKGEVRVNKSRVKPEYKLKNGDQIRVPPVRVSEPKTELAVSESLRRYLLGNVVYEDDSLLVINKPAGLAVHGGDGVSLGLIEALRQVRQDCQYLELVHRLDRETSGCVMIAKKRSMLRHLQAKLRSSGGIDKRYWALAVGSWPRAVTRVKQPLQRLESADGNRVVKVRQDGKPSETLFRVLEAFNLEGVGALSLLEAKPLTGRTHQIRVHAQFIGHPLLGDSKYGVDEINRASLFPAGVSLRLCLHAHSLLIPMPDGEEIQVVAPLLPDFDQLLSVLRKSKN